MREIVWSPTLEERYWSKVDVRGPDECWPWAGYVGNKAGHGKIHIGRNVSGKGIMEWAHRVGWMFANPEFPGESVVRHRCDNPPCQNPTHLELGTLADNVRDMFARGLAVCVASLGEKNGSAKLTEAQVMEILALRDSGLAQREIAERYEVHRSTISRIWRGEKWTHLSAAA